MDDLDTMRAVAGTDDEKRDDRDDRDDEDARTDARSDNEADGTDTTGDADTTDGAAKRDSRRRRKRHAQDEDDAQGVGITLREILNWLVVPVLIVVVLRCFVFGMYVIPSGSMETTLEINDRVVTSRIAAERGDIKRGDVIVFEDPADWLSGTTTQDGSDYLIKRVIGLPGDVVACDGDGAPVTVNGMAIDESSYLKAGVEPSEFSFSVTVTDGNLFVLGDNRANSADSRYHRQDGNDGLVPESKVVGVALAVYWPFADMKTLQNHEDVFANVPAASGVSSSGGTQ